VRALLAAGFALALLLVVSGGAAAQGEPPWQAAQRVQERLFSAQSALLLGEPASTRAADRARRLTAVSSRAGSVATPGQPIAPFGERSSRLAALFGPATRCRSRRRAADCAPRSCAAPMT
jgi:hypothetical protein